MFKNKKFINKDFQYNYITMEFIDKRLQQQYIQYLFPQEKKITQYGVVFSILHRLSEIANYFI